MYYNKSKKVSTHYKLNYLTYLQVHKVLGKVWPGFKNKYDLDIYDLRQFQIFCFFKEYFHRCILYKSMNTKSKAE